MEHIKRDTPSKARRCDSPLTNSGFLGTPIKRNAISKSARTAYQNSTCRFTVLPSRVSSPSGLKNFIIKNPFEPDLNRLHQSVISPTIFTKKPGATSQQSPGFTWTIDELARMRPVEIEEFLPQQTCSPDPELEIRAQAAIDRFFQQNHIVLSPWEIRQRKNKSCVSMETPNRLLELNSTKELKSKKDSWTQTILSLPAALPENVEEVLKPYFTFTQEQSADNDDANSSNNSLRRKLFAFQECADGGGDENDNSTTSLSPVRMTQSMLQYHSPLQSAMFVHGTPLRGLPRGRRQSNESPLVKTKNLTPDISPIHNSGNDMSYKREEHYSRSATRLDFAMDVSVDNVIMENDSSAVNDNQSMVLDENDMKSTEDNQDHRKFFINNGGTNLHDFSNMKTSSKYANSTGNTVLPYATIFNDKNHYDGISEKILTEIGSSMHGNQKRSNTISEALDQPSISNSVQDTGYQTCSMSNTMHTVESYSNISVSHKTHWNEQIIKSKDNTRLSWGENTRNIFSSTPSKCDKQDV